MATPNSYLRCKTDPGFTIMEAEIVAVYCGVAVDRIRSLKILRCVRIVVARGRPIRIRIGRRS